MLDRFQQKFVEEAQDNVAAIEEALFELEKSPDDKEIVERLFRSMHTIKGSGAMFGFNDLSHFTHNLETLYDCVRNDTVKVNKDIISLTFESLDYIRQLLDVGEGTLTDPDDIQRQKDYIAKITKYFPEGQQLTLSSAEKAALAAKQAAGVAAPQPKVEEKGPKNYLVTFAPFESLLNNGTNPLFMLDDLTALGKYKSVAFTGAVPQLDKFDPLNLYVKWQVILSTDQDVNEIKDVFIFVEDECKMDIAELPGGDIVGNAEKLEPIIAKAIESQTELKADDFAVFKEAPKPEPKQEAGTTQAAAKSASPAPKTQENKIASIRVSADKIDDLVNAVSELVTMQAQLNLLAERQEDQYLIAIAEQMEKITRQLRENSFSISLIPLQGELVQFQRLVRDLCNKLGKQIEFVVEGGEIELDKTIIDHLKDPLLHIIRNSGDHGIEMPEERIAKGKNPVGTVLLKAFYSGSSVIVQVSDDGKGMDPDKIFKKAVEKGLVNPNAHLSKKEILNLIFASGFSTAEKVSDVSGRGVGMDVVKSKIAEIRGEVTVDAEVGKGTTITMELPLTLSIIDGLLTRIGGEQFVFPFTNVERILQPEEVKMSDSGMGDFFTYNGDQLVSIDLNKIFNGRPTEFANSKMLIVGQGDKRVGMVVDAVLGEFQIVVKPLGRFLRSVDMISGASVMGDGSLSLIIDPGRLVNYFNQSRLRKKAASAAGASNA
ncbi:MAG: chemotaxis protein CheA [Bacteroidales bacterium]|nr:chemotaxis protein CheA [Bacteroidales bacterium]